MVNTKLGAKITVIATCTIHLTCASVMAETKDNETILMPSQENLTYEMTNLVNQTAKDIVMLNKNGKKPIVIYSDDSKSVPILDVVGTDTYENGENIAYTHKQSEIAEQIKAGTLDKEQIKSAIINSHFPVRSRFKPTQLIVREYAIPKSYGLSLPRPVAIMGIDDYSYAWLKLNLNELKRIKAEIILTEVETYEQYKKFSAMVYPLRVSPVVADVMLEALKIRAYPIVVSNAGAFQ